MITLETALNYYKTDYRLFYTIFTKELVSENIILIVNHKEPNKEGLDLKIVSLNDNKIEKSDSIEFKSYIAYKDLILSTNNNPIFKDSEEEFRQLNPFKHLSSFDEVEYVIDDYYDNVNNKSKYFNTEYKRFKSLIAKAKSKSRGENRFITISNKYSSLIKWLNANSGQNGKATLHYYYRLYSEKVYNHLKAKK